MVKSGLVTRAADPADGRASVLVLSRRGHEVLDGVLGWYDDRLATALRHWTTDDLDLLAALLRRFADDVLAGSHTPNTLLEAAR